MLDAGKCEWEQKLSQPQLKVNWGELKFKSIKFSNWFFFLFIQSITETGATQRNQSVLVYEQLEK